MKQNFKYSVFLFIYQCSLVFSLLDNFSSNKLLLPTLEKLTNYNTFCKADVAFFGTYVVSTTKPFENHIVPIFSHY